jgi:flagellar FliL protein
MADEEIEEEQEEETKSKSKKFPIIIVAVLIVVGLVLAGGISYFITTQVMSSNADSGGAPVHHDPGTFVKLGDAKEGIIVNVGGIKSTRFLKVGIVLELNPGKTDVIADGKVTEVADTKIMDTTLQILRTVKIEELDANKQDDLKTRLKQDINKAIGEGSVYDVYITSFMLQ